MADSFILGGDFGWFCIQCPTVVINPEEVSNYLQHGMPHWDIGDEFMVVGIVDMQAIPREKWNIPLGEEENPIPLVAFTRYYSLEEETSPPHPSSATRRRRKDKRRRKKRRR